MSSKALYRALLALGALLLAWAAFSLFRGSLDERGAALDLPALTLADVDRIEIRHETDSLILAREGSQWTVNGWSADVGQVEQLIGALSDSAATSELIAQNASSHARLGVDATGRTLRLERGGSVLLELIAGTGAGGYQTGYVRHAGSDDVYLYRGRLPGLLGRAVDQWRERRVTRLSADAVHELRIERDRRMTTLTRAGERWTMDGAPADSATMDRLLDGLVNLRAIGFATPEDLDSLDFARPDRALHVLGAAGDTLLALRFDSTSKGYWARTADTATVYRLDFWRVNLLTPTDSALRAKPPE